MSKTAKAMVDLAKFYIGTKEGDKVHKAIIDSYNKYKPLPRSYKVKYTDSWCATFISSLAIMLGFDDIIPIECSCGKMIEIATKKGIWIENENRVPSIGDLVLYDWNDNGKGDNKGYSDHVGIVSDVSHETFIVIEGNYQNSVKERVLQINGKYIRGFIVPKYDKEVSKPSEPLKSISEVAKEVMQGKWGNGSERKARLEKSGYDYNRVQQYINAVYNNEETHSKSVSEVAKEVMNGKWGNGYERKNRLKKAGYDYAEVQKEVNRISKG